MSEVIIEVGPGTIRGANDARPELVSAALDGIDDEIVLLADRPVSVQDVWDDVMGAVAGARVDTTVLVCPAWWPSARIDRARRAAHTVATEVVVLERIAVLRQGISADTTAIVEVTSDVVVVTAFGEIAAVVARGEEPVATAEAVVAAVGAPAGVLVDAPAAVLGAELFASMIADRVRAIGMPVTITDDDWVRQAAATYRSRHQLQSTDVAGQGPAMFSDRKALAVLSGILSAAVLGGGFALVRDSGSDPHMGDAMPMTLLVEGRVGVMVPATWTAQRITSGPGSARVQVVSPTDGDVALHITQSTVPPSSLAKTAESLLAALADATDGAFVEFNPSDRRADRDAVTYREIRPERHVAWTVLVDGTARIAVGCQSVPGSEYLVREACDRAIRSAHAVR